MGQRLVDSGQAKHHRGTGRAAESTRRDEVSFVAPKVFLFCDAGHGRGYGNLYRCRTLACELRRLGVDAVLLACDGAPAAALLRDPMGEAVISLKRADLVRAVESVGAQAASLVVGIDSRHVSRREIAALRAVLPHATVGHMNDAAMEQAWMYDFVVDVDAMPRRNGPAQPRWHLAGPQWAIIRDDVAQLRPNSLAPLGRRVLVCMGAEDPGCTTEAFLEDLSVGGCEGADVTIVCGVGFAPARVAQLAQRNVGRRPPRVVHNPDNWPMLLSEADVVVSMGGQVAYEAMCLGKLVAVLEWSWLAAYVRQLSRLGLCINLGEPRGAAAQLECALSHRLDETESLRRAAWETIDGLGARRLAGRLVTLHNE